MKKIICIGALCISFSMHAMNLEEGFSNQNTQNLQPINLCEEEDNGALEPTESCLPEDEVNANATLNQEENTENSFENRDNQTFPHIIGPQPPSESISFIPENSLNDNQTFPQIIDPQTPPKAIRFASENSLNKGIGISLIPSGSNLYIPPHLKSGSNSESDHSDVPSPVSPSSRPTFWHGYNSKTPKIMIGVKNQISEPNPDSPQNSRIPWSYKKHKRKGSGKNLSAIYGSPLSSNSSSSSMTSPTSQLSENSSNIKIRKSQNRFASLIDSETDSDDE